MPVVPIYSFYKDTCKAFNFLLFLTHAALLGVSFTLIFSLHVRANNSDYAVTHQCITLCHGVPLLIAQLPVIGILLFISL